MSSSGALLGAAVGPERHGENHYARQPPYLLGDHFLVLADRFLVDGKFHGEASARRSRAPVIAASTNSTQCAFGCSRGTSGVQCGRTAKLWTAIGMYRPAVRERPGAGSSPHDQRRSSRLTGAERRGPGTDTGQVARVRARPSSAASGRFRGYGTSLSSLFGEPVPMPVRTLEVAPFTRAVPTAAGEAPGWFVR